MSVKSIRSACGRSRYLPSLGCLLAIVAGSFAPAAAQAPSNFVSWLQSLPPDAQSLPLRRFRYFYEQRAYPNQTIPPGAMAQARQEHEQRFGPLRQQQAPGAAFNQTQWTSIGPKVIAASQLDPRNFPASGRISAIAIDPTTNVNNTNTIFIGGAAGGVWKTEDGGTTWRALTDTQCSLAMGSIAIDPSNNQVIYAGTGELNFGGDNYYGCGLLKSTDGGVTWTQMGGSVFAPSNQAGAKISKVAITGNTLMVASDFGLFRSTDGGSSFTPTPVLGSVGNPVTDLVIDVSNAMIMYAAIGNIFGGPGNGVYKSIDGGASFSPLSPPLSHGFPTTNVGRIALAIAPSASGTVYAAVQRTAPTFGTLLGIWKTTDSGGRWDKLAATGANCGGDDANGRGGQCWYDMYVAVDPTNANTVYFGGFSLYKSTDGGQTFPTDIGSTIHVDQHALAFKPGDANTIYAGNDGGLYVSSNGGGAFASLNDGLVITQFYPGLALNGSPPAVALGGTQDNGTIFTSVANGQSPWFLALGGDGGFAAIDGSTQPRTGYGETQWVANSGYSGPRKSSNIGTNAFVLATTGITLSDRAQFIPPLVMSPSTSSTLYFGTNVVYKTANSAGMWNSISPDLTNGGCCISTIAEAKSNGKVVYVGTGNGLLWMTPDGGTTGI